MNVLDRHEEIPGLKDEFCNMLDITVTCEHIFNDKHLVVTAVVSRRQI